jgi:hypothetical protein
VETRSKYCEAGYSEKTFVELVFMDEVISTTEIEKLSENY